MRELIIGGARSGKSAHAERLADAVRAAVDIAAVYRAMDACAAK